jgi:hypothetical protein
MNYNTSCSTGWRVNATYRHLLELYTAEQAKGHIFLAKEDYLKAPNSLQKEKQFLKKI